MKAQGVCNPAWGKCGGRRPPSGISLMGRSEHPRARESVERPPGVEPGSRASGRHRRNGQAAQRQAALWVLDMGVWGGGDIWRSAGGAVAGSGTVGIGAASRVVAEILPAPSALEVGGARHVVAACRDGARRRVPGRSCDGVRGSGTRWPDRRRPTRRSARRRRAVSSGCGAGRGGCTRRRRRGRGIRCCAGRGRTAACGRVRDSRRSAFRPRPRPSTGGRGRSRLRDADQPVARLVAQSVAQIVALQDAGMEGAVVDRAPAVAAVADDAACDAAIEGLDVEGGDAEPYGRAGARAIAGRVPGVRGRASTRRGGCIPRSCARRAPARPAPWGAGRARCGRLRSWEGGDRGRPVVGPCFSNPGGRRRRYSFWRRWGVGTGMVGAGSVQRRVDAPAGGRGYRSGAVPVCGWWACVVDGWVCRNRLHGGDRGPAGPPVGFGVAAPSLRIANCTLHRDASVRAYTLSLSALMVLPV